MDASSSVENRFPWDLQTSFTTPFVCQGSCIRSLRTSSFEKIDGTGASCESSHSKHKASINSFNCGNCFSSSFPYSPQPNSHAIYISCEENRRVDEALESRQGSTQTAFLLEMIAKIVNWIAQFGQNLVEVIVIIMRTRGRWARRLVQFVLSMTVRPFFSPKPDLTTIKTRNIRSVSRSFAVFRFVSPLLS